MDKMKSDANVPRILKMDGVGFSNFDEANQEKTNVYALIEKYGTSTSWSYTLADSESNSATLICQLPGEGNRMHHHPSWNEWWFIIDGEWEWNIEGKKVRIKKGDFIFMEKNRKHKITAIGEKAAIRIAVSRYDVEHVYE